MKKIEAWHFVTADRRLGYDATDMIVEPGYIYSIKPSRKPELCVYGMHASISAWDALLFAPGGPLTICRVRIWGDVQIGDDKIVGRHREVLWMADADAAIRLYACWRIRQVWHLLTDECSRNAVEVAERFARGKATRDELDAARDATRATVASSAVAHAAFWATAREASTAATCDELDAARNAAAKNEFEQCMLSLAPGRIK